MPVRQQSVTAAANLDLRRVFDYLIDCVVEWESVKSAPAPDLRPVERRFLKAIEGARGTLLVNLLTKDALRRSIVAVKKMWRSPTRAASARQTKLLWGACLLARKIGLRNRFEFVRGALGKKKIYWETGKIKMRVARFERDLQRQEFTFKAKLAVLIELFDGFKRSDFRTHNPKGFYPLRSDSRWLTGLTDEEIQIARGLLREY